MQILYFYAFPNSNNVRNILFNILVPYRSTHRLTGKVHLFAPLQDLYFVDVWIDTVFYSFPDRIIFMTEHTAISIARIITAGRITV